MKHGFSDAAYIKWLNDNLEDRSAVEGLLQEMRVDLDNTYDDIRTVIFSYAHDSQHRPLVEVPECDFDINIVTGLQRELQSTKDLLASAQTRQRNVDAAKVRALAEQFTDGWNRTYDLDVQERLLDLAKEIETA